MKQHIVITGASRGLGAALAARLAGQGVHLSLCARDTSNVGALTELLTSKGSTVDWENVNVGNSVRIIEWIDSIWTGTPIDILILNAGVFDGRPEDGCLENPLRAADLLNTNLNGVIVPALQCAEKMRIRESGHIVFISSLAGFAAHADAPTYSASKAGVTVFARSLREYLAVNNVGVSLFHPGHIDTQQIQNHIGALPGLVSAATAADRIVDAIYRGPCEKSSPLKFRVGLAILNCLPWRMRAKLNRPFRFKVRSPSNLDVD